MGLALIASAWLGTSVFAQKSDIAALGARIAELSRAGLIDRRGRLQVGAPGVRSTPNLNGKTTLEWVIVPAERTSTGRDIVITQHDVNEIQLAKGAIATGLESLLEATGTPATEIGAVIVAGAFGSRWAMRPAWGPRWRCCHTGSAPARNRSPGARATSS